MLKKTVILWAVLFSFAIEVKVSSAARDTPAFFEANGKSLIEAIVKINADAKAKNSHVIEITPEGFKKWYASYRVTQFRKELRTLFDFYLSQNLLPPGYYFEVYSYRLDLTHAREGNDQFAKTVAEGMNLNTWNFAHGDGVPAGITEELFLGTPLPTNTSGVFPASVPVKIQEIQLKYTTPDGRYTYRPSALKVEFEITKANLSDLATYFGTAYSKERVSTRLNELLGTSEKKWISIDDVLEGWVGKWVNRFPGDKRIADGLGSDVCHEVSRQFFKEALSYVGKGDTERLLTTHYELLSESVEPAFGDYLYLPERHSIRFILKDPNSGRWIGFTSWSSAETPYRLWWIDQDYTYPADLPIKSDFPRSMDVWRRLSSFMP